MWFCFVVTDSHHLINDSLLHLTLIVIENCNNLQFFKLTHEIWHEHAHVIHIIMQGGSKRSWGLCVLHITCTASKSLKHSASFAGWQSSKISDACMHKLHEGCSFDCWCGSLYSPELLKWIVYSCTHWKTVKP